MRKRSLQLLLLLLLAALLVPACNRDGFDKSDLDITEVCLKVRGSMVFSYTPGSSQMALNRGRKEFRAGTDTMSDYFLLRLSELPRESGQVLTGTLKWTTSDEIGSRTGLSFKVERIADDGTVWLWNASQKITVVMRLLN